MNHKKFQLFLYLLMRDEVVPGKVEKYCRMAEFEDDFPDEVEYTNKYLASYAKELADRLLDTAK